MTKKAHSSHASTPANTPPAGQKDTLTDWAGYIPITDTDAATIVPANTGPGTAVRRTVGMAPRPLQDGIVYTALDCLVIIDATKNYAVSTLKSALFSVPSDIALGGGTINAHGLYVVNMNNDPWLTFIPDDAGTPVKIPIQTSQPFASGNFRSFNQPRITAPQLGGWMAVTNAVQGAVSLLQMENNNPPRLASSQSITWPDLKPNCTIADLASTTVADVFLCYSNPAIAGQAIGSAASIAWIPSPFLNDIPSTQVAVLALSENQKIGDRDITLFLSMCISPPGGQYVFVVALQGADDTPVLIRFPNPRGNGNTFSNPVFFDFPSNVARFLPVSVRADPNGNVYVQFISGYPNVVVKFPSNGAGTPEVINLAEPPDSRLSEGIASAPYGLGMVVDINAANDVYVSNGLNAGALVISDPRKYSFISLVTSQRPGVQSEGLPTAITGKSYYHKFTGINNPQQYYLATGLTYNQQGLPTPTLGLPPNLQLTAAGELTGSLANSSTGSYVFGISASNNASGYGPATLFTLNTSNSPPPAPPVMQGDSDLGSVAVGEYYTHNFNASNNPDGYYFKQGTTTDATGSGNDVVPASLGLTNTGDDMGLLSGYIANNVAQGKYNFSVHAHNSAAGNGPDKQYTLTVNPPALPVMIPEELPHAYWSQAYSHKFNASGNPNKFEFHPVPSPSLVPSKVIDGITQYFIPQNLTVRSLSSDGTLSTTSPYTIDANIGGGYYIFKIRASNDNGATWGDAAEYTLIVESPPVWDTDNNPRKGNAPKQATNGQTNYYWKPIVWAYPAPSLFELVGTPSTTPAGTSYPKGLVIDKTTGALSSSDGSPLQITSPGPFNFQIKVTNTHGSPSFPVSIYGNV